MFQPWRFKLRQAQEAYKADRLDEARALLCQGDLAEFLPAKKLMAKVAAGLARRGRTQAELGQTAAGWQDLEGAERLGNAAATAELRGVLVARALAEAEASLAADEPASAIDKLQGLQQRGAGTQQVRSLLRVATRAQSARRLTRQGDFAGAAAELESAAQLRPDLTFLALRRDELRQRETTFRAWRAELHQALTGQRWTEVMDLSERLLELAPEDDVAADAKARAWAAAGMTLKPTPKPRANAATAPWQPRAPRAEQANHQELGGMPTNQGLRFLLWVDGVGGYLVCEGDDVVLGQPVSGSRVDVPLLGDLSRSHATIRRSGEGYLIVPRRSTRLEGREIQDAAVLTDGATLELGRGVRLRFCQSHPLSRSARLEFLSRHRTQPPADGVLLMADSCILGPAAASHVVCPDWRQTVVLFHRDNQLYCRADGEYQIDGQTGRGQRPIERNSRIMGEEFAIKLEELEP